MEMNDLEREGDDQRMAHYLDRQEVLEATVIQLRKDLSLNDDELKVPALSDRTFEELRAQVVPVLQRLLASSTRSLQVAMYRVDVPEGRFHRAMAAGGAQALAGETVLRCLQKVLTRARFAGR